MIATNFSSSMHPRHWQNDPMLGSKPCYPNSQARTTHCPCSWFMNQRHVCHNHNIMCTSLEMDCGPLRSLISSLIIVLMSSSIALVIAIMSIYQLKLLTLVQCWEGKKWCGNWVGSWRNGTCFGSKCWRLTKVVNTKPQSQALLTSK